MPALLPICPDLALTHGQAGPRPYRGGDGGLVDTHVPGRADGADSIGAEASKGVTGFGRPFLFTALLAFACASPGFAAQDCKAVIEKTQAAISTAQPQSENCEIALEQSRGLLQEAADAAVACGCGKVADSLRVNIEKTHSTEYSCWNKSQALSALDAGIQDAISIYCE